MQVVSDAERWLAATFRSTVAWDGFPWAAAAVASLIVLLALVVLLRARRRRRERAEALARKVDEQAQRLRAELRKRLWEQPKLFDDHLNGAPTMGAQEAFESDIMAAASTVLREAGGERRKARELLRQRLMQEGTGGSDGLNGSEAGVWRQLGALALVEGSRDAIAAYRRAADLAPTCAEGQMLLGVLHLRGGSLEAAERAFRQQVELASSPEQAPIRYRGRTMLGDVCAARHAPDEALAAYCEAQAEIEALRGTRPAEHQEMLKRDLSVTLDRIGDIHFSRGDLDDALVSYQRALVIAEGLARAAGDGDLNRYRDLSVSYERIGDLLDKKGDLAGAHLHFKKGLAIAKALMKRDPRNRDWAWDLSASYERLADVLHARGEADEALKTYRKGLDIAEKVMSSSGISEATQQRDLAVSYHKIGSLEALRGNEADARDLLEKGRAIIAQLDRIAAHSKQWRSDLSKFDQTLKTLH